MDPKVPWQKLAQKHKAGCSEFRFPGVPLLTPRGKSGWLTGPAMLLLWTGWSSTAGEVVPFTEVWKWIQCQGARKAQCIRSCLNSPLPPSRWLEFGLQRCGQSKYSTFVFQDEWKEGNQTSRTPVRVTGDSMHSLCTCQPSSLNTLGHHESQDGPWGSLQESSTGLSKRDWALLVVELLTPYLPSSPIKILGNSREKCSWRLGSGNSCARYGLASEEGGLQHSLMPWVRSPAPSRRREGAPESCPTPHTHTMALVHPHIYTYFTN